MKHLFGKWLAALLIMALLAPVAFMEGTRADEIVKADEPLAEPDASLKDDYMPSGYPVSADDATPEDPDATQADDAEEDDKDGPIPDEFLNKVSENNADATETDDEEIIAAMVDDTVKEETVELDEESDISQSIKESDEGVMDSFEMMFADSTSGSNDDQSTGIDADGYVQLNTNNFGDEYFLDYLKRECDKDKDGRLSQVERDSVTTFSFNSGFGLKNKLTSLIGLKYFSNLNSVYCSSNKLTELDVSGCLKLSYLDCENNNLGLLNVDGCNQLVKLYCYMNNLTSLNLSTCPRLQTVYCFDNSLTELVLTNCIALEDLSCGNNSLTTIDANDCAKLKKLWCGHNEILSTLNIENCKNLVELTCSYNSINSLEISGNVRLQELSCGHNSISTLDARDCLSLTQLDCAYNGLTTLNITNCKALEKLNCESNKFATLDISTCPKLVYIVDKKKNPPKYLGTSVYYKSVLDFWCDDDVQIIGGNPAPPKGLEPSPSPTRTPKPTRTPRPITLYTYSPTQVITTPGTLNNSSRTRLIRLNVVYRNSKFSTNVGTVFQIINQGKNFRSSKKSVATVDYKGLVTTYAGGKTKITFKVGKKKYKLVLTVVDPTIPSSVMLTVTTTNVKKGDTVTLMPAVPDGTDAGGYKWKSSNKKVATVKNGVVTFKKAGKVTITCTSKRGKKKAKIKFNVSK